MKQPPSQIRQLLALMLAFPTIALAQHPPGIDPKADEVLKKMGQTLAGSKGFTFDAHAIVDQLMPDGRKLQYAKNQKVQVARPDKIAADMTGDVEDLQLRYDSKQVTIYNPRTNSWGGTDAPASIDATLDMLAQKYGMIFPLADLLFADPYKCLTENVRTGEHIGIGYVFDAKCHHLAFRQASVDWQIWIEEGDKPLPRKVVITFKDSPAHPQYTAFISNWNLSADLPKTTFEFTPPAGAKKVEFAPATQPATPKDKP